MKKIVAALVLAVPLFAQAEMLAYTSNLAGGRIVLTQRDCPKTKQGVSHVAFLTDGGGEVSDVGCWGHAKPFYVVTWKSNNATRFYNEEEFKYTDLDKQ